MNVNCIKYLGICQHGLGTYVCEENDCEYANPVEEVEIEEEIILVPYGMF